MLRDPFGWAQGRLRNEQGGAAAVCTCRYRMSVLRCLAQEAAVLTDRWFVRQKAVVDFLAVCGERSARPWFDASGRG